MYDFKLNLFRLKIIKEKNNSTGNTRNTWRYLGVMEEMFAGDPAVNPTTIVSSIIIKDTCNAVKWKMDRAEWKQQGR